MDQEGQALLKAEPLERRVVTAPLRPHLDDQLEQDLVPEEVDPSFAFALTGWSAWKTLSSPAAFITFAGDV